jgi:DNA-binding NtrC family response regulator
MKLLEAAERPLYLLNEQRRIVFCNPALAEWAGFEASQLIGRRCDYHTQPVDDPLDRCVAGLCPPPESLAGREMQGTVGCHTAGGEYVQRRAEFLPLGQDPSHCPGVIVFLSANDATDAADSGLERADSTAPQLHHWLARLQARQSDRYHISRLTGESPAIRRVRSQVELASQSGSPVLIVGPPGSGREHVARTIHYAGEVSAHAPLVPLSCSLLDAELLRMTVTAFMRQCAELETEQSAALMLLEVDQLAADAQSELVGFLTIIELELQPIATARRSLLELAREGGFREDLAHALSTLIIDLPALTQRRSDIPLVAQAFVEEINAEGNQQRGGFTPEALDLLSAYGWPQNLDELASVVREAHRRADRPLIGAADLPRKIHLATETAVGGRPGEDSIVLQDFLEQIETQLIQRALKRSKGNKTKAARLLGMNRARLLRRLAQLSSEGGA